MQRRVKKTSYFTRAVEVRTTVVASSKRWPWPSSTPLLTRVSNFESVASFAGNSARVCEGYWKIRWGGRAVRVSSFGTVQR